jgi:hypothetical protein
MTSDALRMSDATSAIVLPTARRVSNLFAGAPLDVIKLVAATAMVLDHSNKIVFDYKVIEFWYFGRLAFPYFHSPSPPICFADCSRGHTCSGCYCSR